MADDWSWWGGSHLSCPWIYSRVPFIFFRISHDFFCILKRMFGVYGAYQPCSIYFHDGPVQMHVAAETPPGWGVDPCSPLHKVQTLQLRASHFIRVNAWDRYFSVKWREGGRISMSILSGKYSVSYLTWNSTRLKCWSRQPQTWHSKSPPQRNPVHATSFQNMELLWQKGD